jgi:hypothetical protein
LLLLLLLLLFFCVFIYPKWVNVKRNCEEIKWKGISLAFEDVVCLIPLRQTDKHTLHIQIYIFIYKTQVSDTNPIYSDCFRKCFIFLLTPRHKKYTHSFILIRSHVFWKIVFLLFIFHSRMPLSFVL